MHISCTGQPRPLHFTGFSNVRVRYVLQNSSYTHWNDTRNSSPKSLESKNKSCDLINAAFRDTYLRRLRAFLEVVLHCHRQLAQKLAAWMCCLRTVRRVCHLDLQSVNGLFPPEEPDGSHPPLGDREGPILNLYQPPLHNSVLHDRGGPFPPE